MKKIIIINKVIIGIRPYPFGYDGLNISFLKKSLSSKLQDKLNEYFKNNNINNIEEIDKSYKPIEEIIDKNVYKVLISPYIKDKICLQNLNKNIYYILTEEEFNNCFIDNILKNLEIEN